MKIIDRKEITDLDFIKICIEILKDDGLLLFITPTNVKNYLTCF